MKFWDDVGDPSYSFQRRFTVVSHEVSRRRYSHSKLLLSCEVDENRSTVFGPKFLWDGEPKKLRQFVTVVYPYHVAKLG